MSPDADLRHDVRSLAMRVLTAVERARRWQLVVVAPSLAMLVHILEERPHAAAGESRPVEDSNG